VRRKSSVKLSPNTIRAIRIEAAALDGPVRNSGLMKKNPRTFQKSKQKMKSFSLESLYSQTVQKRIGLLSAFGISKSITTSNNVIFGYRPKEIFALTTGQAYNCVQWCSDYDFPAQIAARLLGEKGQLETSHKGLIGNQVSTRRTQKTHEQKNISLKLWNSALILLPDFEITVLCGISGPSGLTRMQGFPWAWQESDSRRDWM